MQTPRAGGIWLGPAAVLLIGLAGCVALVSSALRERHAYDAKTFERMASGAEDEVTQRFMVYVDTLRSGAAFLRSSDDVNRSEWREFAVTLNTEERYPGIRGVGVIFPVAQPDLDSFLANVGADAGNGFVLHAPGTAKVDGSEHAILTYIEPLQRNTDSLGLDMYAETKRREAAMEARDSGLPRLTHSIELVQDGLHRPGAMLFVPVYRREAVPATVQQRRSDHFAWICAPFVFEELFRSVIGRREGILNLDLFEGPATSGSTVLYRSPGRREEVAFERVHVVELAGRSLTFAWTRGARFSGTPLGPVLWAGGIGGLGSLVLAGLVWSIQGTGRRARALADELTNDIVRQQDALRDSEARLRASLKEVTDLKTAIDAHAIVAITDARGIITYANDRFCEVSDYPRADIVGHSHRIVKSGRHPPEFYRSMWETISAGRIWRGEICNRRRGGQLYWVDTTIVPFVGEDGRPVQYIAIRTEITQRVELEQNLAVARDQALEASRLKSEFLATMSHEIRTPMNAIIGMAGLLSDTPLRPEQSEMLRIVTGAAESLLTIINDILDFSRIEAGQLRLDQAEFDLARVIGETVSLLASRAHAKHIRLDYAFDPSPSSLLLGDAGRVRQVLLNLIGNAVKFTEAGGVSVTAAVKDETGNRVRVRVAVTDTGIGIPDDARDRLFHPFVQVDGSATRKFGGTGLGLAITRQLVNAMGGDISFESRVGRGTTFTFELEFPRGGPFANPVAALPPVEHAALSRVTLGLQDAGDPVAGVPPPPPPATKAGFRLLLVEDNTANQQVAIRLLQKLGHSVEVVNNGHAALERLAVDRFHAVLMDCQMPSLDGYETTRWIRSGKLPGVDADIVVIAVTAYARDEDRDRCLQAGMDGYVSKPIRAPELQAALSAVLEPGRPRREKRRPAAGRAQLDSILDAEVLETTRALPGMRGPSLLPELVTLYLSKERSRLDSIRRLVAERSEGAADEVHGFGGDAASFGGMEVRSLALELEADVRANDWTRANARLAELEHACARLRDAVVVLGGQS